MKRSQLALAAAIGVVVMLTMLAGTYLKQSRRQQIDGRNTAREIEASVTRRGDARSTVASPPPPKTQPVPEPVKQEAPKANPPDTKTRSWPVAYEKEEKIDEKEYEIMDCVVDAEGTRALAKSKRDIQVIDLTSGKTLQTFRAPPHDNRQPGSETLFPAPDARCVAVFTETTNKPAAKVIQFLEADTAR